MNGEDDGNEERTKEKPPPPNKDDSMYLFTRGEKRICFFFDGGDKFRTTVSPQTSHQRPSTTIALSDLRRGSADDTTQ